MRDGRVGSSFFFSSRRRHTRWTDDWSSDVCSSDLLGAVVAAIGIADTVSPMTAAILMLLPLSAFEATAALPAAAVQLTRSRIAARRLRELVEPAAERSEERRVGKECRARWAREHEK